MNLPDDHDIVDRAVRALKATAGADALPDVVVDDVRRKMNECVVARSTSSVDTAQRGQVSWLTLAACVALMVTSSWMIGFQKSLLSQVTVQQTFPNGSVLTHYTDGRVIASLDQPTSPIQ